MKKRRNILFLLLVCCLFGLSIRTVASAGTQKEALEKTTGSSVVGVAKEAIAEPTTIPEQMEE